MFIFLWMITGYVYIFVNDYWLCLYFYEWLLAMFIFLWMIVTGYVYIFVNDYWLCLYFCEWLLAMFIWFWFDFWCFNATFSYIMATSFSGGRSRRTRRTTDHGQATGKLYHLWLRVECILFCKLQSRARTHALLVIGLHELLGNPTT